MDIATVVRLKFMVNGSHHDHYHVRFSTKEQGPQREGEVLVLDTLYRRDGETTEDFRHRAERYVKELMDDT